jgi:hypothetical protein
VPAAAVVEPICDDVLALSSCLLAYGIFLTSQANHVINPEQCSALRAWVRRRGNAAQQFSGPGVERGHNRAAERFLAPDLRRFALNLAVGGLPCGGIIGFAVSPDSPADASLTIAPVRASKF